MSPRARIPLVFTLGVALGFAAMRVCGPVPQAPAPAAPAVAPAAPAATTIEAATPSLEDPLLAWMDGAEPTGVLRPPEPLPLEVPRFPHVTLDPVPTPAPPAPGEPSLPPAILGAVEEAGLLAPAPLLRGTAALWGRVLDEDGTPVAGAFVRAFELATDRSVGSRAHGGEPSRAGEIVNAVGYARAEAAGSRATRTATDGSYYLSDLPAGNARVHAVAPGLVFPVRRWVSSAGLPEGAKVRHDIQGRRAGRLLVEVLDPRGVPVPSARLELPSGDGRDDVLIRWTPDAPEVVAPVGPCDIVWEDPPRDPLAFHGPPPAASAMVPAPPAVGRVRLQLREPPSIRGRILAAGDGTRFPVLRIVAERLVEDRPVAAEEGRVEDDVLLGQAERAFFVPLREAGRYRLRVLGYFPWREYEEWPGPEVDVGDGTTEIDVQIPPVRLEEGFSVVVMGSDGALVKDAMPALETGLPGQVAARGIVTRWLVGGGLWVRVDPAWRRGGGPEGLRLQVSCSDGPRGYVRQVVPVETSPGTRVVLVLGQRRPARLVVDIDATPSVLALASIDFERARGAGYLGESRRPIPSHLERDDLEAGPLRVRLSVDLGTGFGLRLERTIDLVEGEAHSLRIAVPRLHRLRIACDRSAAIALERPLQEGEHGRLGEDLVLAGEARTVLVPEGPVTLRTRLVPPEERDVGGLRWVALGLAPDAPPADVARVAAWPPVTVRVLQVTGDTEVRVGE